MTIPGKSTYTELGLGAPRTSICLIEQGKAVHDQDALLLSVVSSQSVVRDSLGGTETFPPLHNGTLMLESLTQGETSRTYHITLIAILLILRLTARHQLGLKGSVV
jgi:hypothetical protein